MFRNFFGRVSPDGLTQRDLPWIAIGALMAGVFALVGYDQLRLQHFEAWRLYPDGPIDDATLSFLRGAINGWYRQVVTVLFLLGGGLSVSRLIGGRRLPAVVLAVGLIVQMMAAEMTQSVGQEPSPVSEIQQVSAVSVFLAITLGLLPATAMAWSLRRSPDQGRASSRTPLRPHDPATS